MRDLPCNFLNQKHAFSTHIIKTELIQVFSNFISQFSSKINRHVIHCGLTSGDSWYRLPPRVLPLEITLKYTHIRMDTMAHAAKMSLTMIAQYINYTYCVSQLVWIRLISNRKSSLKHIPSFTRDKVCS